MSEPDGMKEGTDGRELVLWESRMSEDGRYIYIKKTALGGDVKM